MKRFRSFVSWLTASVLLLGASKVALVTAEEIPTTDSAPSYKVNRDFLLLPEMTNMTKRPEHFDMYTRIQWQMRRYRNGATFGLLENKLLSNDLLTSLDIPVAPVFYGAFTHKPLGKWPKYNREEFLHALKTTEAIAKHQHFVLKPASSGGSDNVLIMNKHRWQQENWTFDKVVEYAENFLFREWSELGQRCASHCLL